MAKRLQVDLSDEGYEALKRMAGNGSISDTVRRALNTEALIQQEEARGARIYIEEPNGERIRLARV